MDAPSSPEVRGVVLAAVDFLRERGYLDNPDVVVACEILRSMAAPPTHNMIIDTRIPEEQDT